MSESTLDSSVNKSKINEAPLIEGSLWRSIWIMSWPLLLMTISTSIVSIVDTQVAGKLGSISQAAVGISEQVVFVFMVFVMSVGVGTTAVASRAFGAKDHDKAIHTAGQSMTLSVGIGILLSLMSMYFSEPLMRTFSPSTGATMLASSYLKIYSFYLLPFSVVSIMSATFRSAGDTKTPLLVVAIMTVINIILDYALVCYNWPIAHLGVKGIAYAGLISSFVGSLIAIYRIKCSSILKDSLNRLLPLNLEIIKRILTIGLPSGFQKFGWALSIFAMFFILKHCANPTEAIASWTIGIRTEGVVFMPMLALSLAVSSIIGQNLGAKQVDRAFQAGWHVTAIGFVLMVILAVVMFCGAHLFAHLMSSDATTIGYTISYLRINAIAEPMLAISMVLSGALQGAGDTQVSMWISLVAQWLIRLPLAWLLALHFHLGPQGAWISMTTSMYCLAILMTLRYQSKAWIKIQV
jgi:putative MATE family efflux protein